MKGRARKPDEQHILAGTFRADRHGDPSTSIVAEGLPVRPRNLQGAARKVWDAVVPKIIEMGTAKEIDSDSLATYCRMVVIRDEIVAAVLLMEVMDDRRAKLSREVKDYEGMIDKLRQQFGIGAMSRSRLRAPTAPAAQKVMSRKRG